MTGAEDVEQATRRLRAASQEALENAPVLERWQVDRTTGRAALIGFVFGHPLFADGRFVRTSALKRIAPEAGWALTRNRYYRLGAHMDDWRRSLQ